MPRNKSEKLPAFAKTWSPEGIELVREMAKELAKVNPIEYQHKIAGGHFRTPAWGRELYRARSVAASMDYNRDRPETYELMAYFFAEAHAKKQK